MVEVVVGVVVGVGVEVVVVVEVEVGVEVEVDMKTCANPKCNKPFTPKRKEQRYCHHKCSVKPNWGWQTQGRGSWGEYK